MLKGVIWDCGGVIINFDASITDRQLSAACKISPEKVNSFLYGSSAKEREFNAGAIEDYYLGRCDSATFYQTVRQGLDIQLSEREFELAWNATLTTPNAGIIRFIHELGARSLQQAVLSSTNPWHWDRMNELSKIYPYPSLEDFLTRKRIVTSYDIGHKKPAPELFAAACAALGLPKEECIYVDDIKKYTDAALAWGMGAAVHVDITRTDFVELCINGIKSLVYPTR
ncbi:MAG TPA: HAD-IA family hydrolase [Candidatus Nanoarchaeia archaeon]|nr:HAD-IA family hydrolase [Candidatus Nanoarchaeia archaeon]